MKTKGRIEARFDALAREGRSGLAVFITGGDPDDATSLSLLESLPGAGADMIELGMPFSDPMADGPAIQESSRRALEAGASLAQTLKLVRAFRKTDTDTPLVLMGYYNPVHSCGVADFVREAQDAGADGVIIVDLPFEEDGALRDAAGAHNLRVIRLVAPTSDDKRLAHILTNAEGFVYMVAITGITGGRGADMAALARYAARVRAQTTIPLAVGFGIKTPQDAARAACHAQMVVVGSAIVGAFAHKRRAEGLHAARARIRALADAVRAQTA